jgi:hypothetical protein
MSSFIRFIFFILIAGGVLNLAIVMFANVQTHQKQVQDLAAERERFSRFIALVDNQWRLGEIAVEWQRVGPDENVLETSLLVREFMPVDDGQPIPLPLHRIIIPGDRLCVDGLKLEFKQWFTEDYKELRGATLFYFDHVYAEQTPEKDRFSFLTPYSVPQATQIHFTYRNPHPTYFESKLWDTLWDVIQNPNHEKLGLAVTWLDPAVEKLKRGALYKITVGLEGVKIEEDDMGINRTVRNDMLQEGKELPAAANP